MKILDTQRRDVQALTNIEPTGRVLLSRLPNVGVQLTLASNTAYFVYMGRTTQPVNAKYVEFFVSAAAGASSPAEVGLFSTPNAPNKSPTQVLTKLIVNDGLTSLTTDRLMARNATAFNGGAGYIVPAGVHLWAGIRTQTTGAQPSLGGLCMDYDEGLILSTAAANALTGSGPWTGSRITMTTTTYLNTPLAPDLRVTLD
jgi:hypothetical protein